MKKILLISMAVLLVAAMSMPAAAVENEFGGYWRTRAFSQMDFNGTDNGTFSTVDTRTRLYYTAKFNDTFKFVNKFEFDPIWGDTTAGDVGADGNVFELKNSYVDLSMSNYNLKVGIHSGEIARGFLFSDDFSGVTLTCKLGAVTLPIMWVKASDSDLNSANVPTTPIDETKSRDYLALSPVFKVSETLSVNPYVLYDKEQGSDTAVYYVGADVNAKVENVKAWGTAIYQGGETANVDNSAFLVAAGADAGLVHGQFFYATGDDGSDPTESTEFAGPKGRSYYWSEIMGLGMFGDTGAAAVGNLSPAAPADAISDVMAVNVGTSVKAMEKLTLTGDLWYAQLAEDNAAGDKDLGFEVDLKATYAIMDNLKLDVVAAYLFAGDAYTAGDNDPIEIGTQLSLSF